MEPNTEYTYMIPKYHLRPYFQMENEKIYHSHFLTWDTGVDVFIEDLDQYM